LSQEGFSIYVNLRTHKAFHVTLNKTIVFSRVYGEVSIVLFTSFRPFFVD